VEECEVLVLADGTKINKATGEVIRPESEAPELLSVDEGVDNSVGDEAEGEAEVAEIKRLLPVNRHINDLPGDTNSTKAIGLITALSLYGINDREISFICGTEMEKIIAIKQSERYNDMLGGIIENVMRAQSDNIRAIFVNNAKEAAHHIVSGLNSKVPEVRHMSAKEVLDRGGFRPVDVVEHRVRHENELKIVHIRGDAEKSVVIEADYENAT
jgi:hypothetical protein